MVKVLWMDHLIKHRVEMQLFPRLINQEPFSHPLMPGSTCAATHRISSGLCFDLYLLKLLHR